MATKDEIRKETEKIRIQKYMSFQDLADEVGVTLDVARHFITDGHCKEVEKFAKWLGVPLDGVTKKTAVERSVLNQQVDIEMYRKALKDAEKNQTRENTTVGLRTEAYKEVKRMAKLVSLEKQVNVTYKDVASDLIIFAAGQLKNSKE